MRKQIYDAKESIFIDILRDSDIDLAGYKEFVRSKFNSQTARDNLLIYGTNRTEVTGSSILANTTLANMTDEPGMLPNGYKPGTREDMEFMLSKDPDYFNGIYLDFGPALITPYDNWEPNGRKPNDAIAKDLAEQLKKREIKLPETGLIIPQTLFGLPREDSNSFYGLMPVIAEFTSSETREEIKNIDDYTWNPNWIITDGLARAYLNGKVWGRDGGDLGFSGSGGRVVIKKI
jgi:hypothetical protein